MLSNRCNSLKMPAGACRALIRGCGLSLAVVVFLSGPLTAQEERAAADRAPAPLDHGWPVAAPSEVGLDADALEALATRMEAREFGQVDAFLVIRDGKLAFERYFGGHNAYTLHTEQSVTKSVTSTLIGIAYDMGILRNLEEPIYEFFPERAAVFETDPAKKEITLHHMLTMTAGFDWPELDVSYGGENIVWAYEDSRDWVGYVLERPLTSEPGDVFTYSTGVSTVLGAILQSESGMTANLFAERYLFDALGIPNYGWWRNMVHPDHWAHTGGGLHLAPRDLAKIGYLYVNEGRWNGTQVISPEWIELSTQAHLGTGRSPTESYGYQWWLWPLKKDGGSGTSPNDVIHARGLGGQNMFVIPARDMVVVINSTGARLPIDVLYDEILPAQRE